MFSRVTLACHGAVQAAGFSLALLAVLPAYALDTGTTGIVTTASGLQYRDVVIGKGALAATGQSVQVHYTGWLQNPDGSAGKKFDSSKDRGEPFGFPLGGGRVIRGWDEGVAGMRVGGMRRLTIPATLGYGSRGAADVIPPNSTLIFDVELLGVK